MFPYEYRAYISLSEDGGVSVSGQAVEQAAKTTEDGTVLLPIRAISEALGLSVSWDTETWRNSCRRRQRDSADHIRRQARRGYYRRKCGWEYL